MISAGAVLRSAVQNCFDPGVNEENGRPGTRTVPWCAPQLSHPIARPATIPTAADANVARRRKVHGRSATVALAGAEKRWTAAQLRWCWPARRTLKGIRGYGGG